jgi:signal transduction histidine kinase
VKAKGDASPFRFPVKAVGIGLCVMLLLTLASGLLAFQTQRHVRTLSKSQVAVILGAQRLRRLAEVSGLSVRLAVATGDEAYAADYESRRGEIDAAFRDLNRAMVLPANMRTAGEAVKLGRQLAAVQDRALQLSRSGSKTEAARLLDSAPYRSVNEVYLADLASIRQRSTAYAADLQNEIDRNSWITFIANLIGFPLIGIALALLLRPARKWGVDIDRARIAAEAVSEAKAEFVAVMSHELRTPLNCVLGFTELLLRDDALTAEQRRRVESVEKAADALTTTIDDVLDFSALEAGSMSLHRQEFDLAALIADSIALVEVIAEAKKLELRIVVDPALAHCYVGDRQRLRQILLNLLSNATKFTAEGFVELNLSLSERSPAADRIRFEVRDSGCGIEPEMQAKLFERYSRASGAGLDQHGTGLGLSISKRLVELMGGQIGADSTHGQGATFWFELPLTTGSDAG